MPELPLQVLALSHSPSRSSLSCLSTTRKPESEFARCTRPGGGSCRRWSTATRCRSAWKAVGGSSGRSSKRTRTSRTSESSTWSSSRWELSDHPFLSYHMIVSRDPLLRLSWVSTHWPFLRLQKPRLKPKLTRVSGASESRDSRPNDISSVEIGSGGIFFISISKKCWDWGAKIILLWLPRLKIREDRVDLNLPWWGSIRCKHIAREQHLSQIKSRLLFWLVENVFSPIKT